METWAQHHPGWDVRLWGNEDLVGREQVQIDMEPVRRLLNGKRVLDNPEGPGAGVHTAASGFQQRAGIIGRVALIVRKATDRVTACS